MSRNDSLYELRPPAAAQHLSELDSPAIPLSGLSVQRALKSEHRRLFAFEISSPELLATGLLRAAMQLDAIVALCKRPQIGSQDKDLTDFAQKVFHACGRIGFRHPLVLSAGPFSLSDDPSADEVSALKGDLSSALDAGFTDASVAVTSPVPNDAVVGALREAIQVMASQEMLLEVVLPEGSDPKVWLDVLGPSDSLLLSLSEASDARSEGAFWGVRPASGEFPDEEDEQDDASLKSFDRLTGDPLSEIAMQVLDEGDAEALQARVNSGKVRQTDAVSEALADLSDVSADSVRWTDQNTYFFALDLLRSAGCAGSAASVRRFLTPDVPDTDPEEELDTLLSELAADEDAQDVLHREKKTAS